jgi:predicted NAD/FAD-binding protein
VRIAVVGTGISGLVAAHHLAPRHEVTVFEAGAQVGGHTATVEVDDLGRPLWIDTGFITFNDRTYPSFIQLMARLGVASRPSSMSLSVRDEATGREWGSASLAAMFAQRRNLLRPSFLRMLAEIVRWNHEAKALVTADLSLTLGDWLAGRGYSETFVENYLVPMGAAIWSADPVAWRSAPARFLARFFDNHGMLTVFDHPQWRTIVGGSRSYLEPITRPFADRIRLATPVRRVRRFPDGVEVATDAGAERFDEVVLACHADTALALLADPSPAELEVLGALPYQENETVLHTDTSLLPRRKAAWSSWNYHVLGHVIRPAPARVSVTYCMNVLQGLEGARRTYCVTLNRTEAIDPRLVLRRFTYHHPVFTRAGVAAQARHAEVSGPRRTHYCGAYWGFGFHEDGVVSALRVVDRLLGPAPPPRPLPVLPA